jgi:putative DNA primase/helicase
MSQYTPDEGGGRVRASTSQPGANGQPRPTLSDEARDVLDYLDVLWPTSADASAAAQAADLVTCSAWTMPKLDEFVRGRQILIASQDDDEGIRRAQAVAQQCEKFQANSIRIWRVPGFGSKHRTMKEWCASNSLTKTLELVYSGQWADFAVFAGESPQVCPDFSALVPRPITADLLPVPPLEPEMIPEPFRPWVKDIANRGWFPLENVVAALIVAMSGLIGRKLGIKPKRYDDWLVIPNLWGGIVGSSGLLKTPSVEEPMRPLKRLVADALQDHQQAVAEWQQRCLVAKAKKDVAKKELEAAAKKKLSDARLAELAAEASAAFEEPEPKPKRYVVNDPTMEKLGELMAENPNGLILFRDELSGFLRTLDRQGHESDRGFYLESWNGNGSYTFDRIGRGTIHIPAVCLALFGTIQPGPLAKYLRGTISGEEADGFIPRFQVLVHPDPPEKFINVDRCPNTATKNAAYAIFQAIDRLDPTALGCEVDLDSGLPFIRFADDAQQFFNQWRVELENRLRSGTLSNVVMSHLSKYRSLMPSLAEQFHLITLVGPTGRIESLPPVSLQAAMTAAAWCVLLEAHARRIYQAASDGDPDDAIRLAERIKESLPNPFTYRIVAKKGWSGLSTSEEVRKAVDLLEDRGWVKVVEVPSADPSGRGRPSEQVWVNPKVMDATDEVHP